MSLVKENMESVMKHTGTPHETIYTIYDEMSKYVFYPHGKLNK
jgi:phenylpyruvate tautomerase PptA (4-oxalocrotonate tautomerase family)